LKSNGLGFGAIGGSFQHSARHADQHLMCIGLAEPKRAYREEPLPSLPSMAHAEAEV